MKKIRLFFREKKTEKMTFDSKGRIGRTEFERKKETFPNSEKIEKRKFSKRESADSGQNSGLTVVKKPILHYGYKISFFFV